MELASPSISSPDLHTVAVFALIYVEVKCSKMGKQPCPVCLGGCRAPAENALVMTLITAMALQVLVPATLTKDRFMLCKSVPPQR